MHTISKTEKTQVRIQLSDYKDKTYIDIRTFVDVKDKGFIATPKGISIEPEHLNSLIEALQAIRDDIKKPNIKCRYEIMEVGAKLEGKPRFNNLSAALAEEGTEDEYIFEIQKIEGKVVKVPVYKWRKETWRKVTS